MQAQYRAYAQQAPQRSPHATSQRRGGGGPIAGGGAHAPGAVSQAQLAQQQQAHAQANELAKRRSRKPTDKSIPDGVDDNIVNPDAVQRYKDLRDIERLLDTTITRKRLDVMENGQRATSMQKTLRIWISNTVEDQVWQGSGLNVDAFDFNPTMEASYRVKIEGCLLDDEKATKEQQSTSSAANGQTESTTETVSDATKPVPKHMLSHFFRAIHVDFDKSRSRSGAEHTVEWKKPEGPAGPSPANQGAASDFDEFTFKRNGDENINITVNFFRNELPERYKLSPDLARVVDMTEATQQEAVMGLWEYIRAAGLQEDEEKRNFRCDEPLRKVVGRGDIGFIPMLNDYVTQHLQPLPPISLTYTIRVDEEFHKDPKPTIYDINVAVEDPLRATLSGLLNKPEYAATLKDIAAMDDQLARVIQAISLSKAKHSFLTSLSDDPASFVKSWLSSQKRDLEVILGEVGNGGENTTGDEWRKGGSDSVWASKNALESVNVLLSRQR